MKVINNILKLEGYGVYVTVVKGTVYECPINLKTGGPSLDPDGCIEWTECDDPPNQEFLNLINKYLGGGWCMNHFSKNMSISDIKSYTKTMKEAKGV